jgi:large subunit ribosomal protein L4e
MSRPVVSVFEIDAADNVGSTVTLPAVFTAPIRADVVHYVHTLMAKNKRQAYAVSTFAGMQVSNN